MCQHRRDTFSATAPGEVTIARMVDWVHADHRAIGALKAPSGAEDLRKEILAVDAEMVDAIDQAVARAEAQPNPAAAFAREVSGIQAREQQVRRAMPSSASRPAPASPSRATAHPARGVSDPPGGGCARAESGATRVTR